VQGRVGRVGLASQVAGDLTYLTHLTYLTYLTCDESYCDLCVRFTASCRVLADSVCLNTVG